MSKAKINPGITQALLPLSSLKPHASQFELEFTNVCNAKCSACPRDDMPKAGMLSEEVLDLIMNYYSMTISNPDMLPECIIAGGGEPLINKRAVTLLEKLIRNGFKVNLTTNASRLTPTLIEQLVQLRLNCIYVSFWGIEKTEYEQAMQLPFEPTLEKVKALAEAMKGTETPVLVKWLKTPFIKSSNEQIAEFWRNLGIGIVEGYHDEWNRGGLHEVETSIQKTFFPDPSRPIWCTDIYFSDTFNWRGDCILCCCNYFTSQQIKIGNVRDNTYAELIEKKMEIMRARPLPEMCQKCMLPRDTRGKWLARGILNNLSKEDQAMLTHY